MKTCSLSLLYSLSLPFGGRSVRRFFLLAAFVAIAAQQPLPAFAQDASQPPSPNTHHPSPVKENSTMVALGAANILDTYLSQEKYTGSELRIISQSRKPWRGFMQTFIYEGAFSFVSNRADNNDEMGGAYRFQYHLRRQWKAIGGFDIEAGAAIGAHVGFLYNTRNSNNPAQAYADLNLMPSAAVRHSIPLFKRQARLNYEVTAPLIGLMFSPNYGQSYYEIFSRGNYDHNIVLTTIASTPSLRHMLTLDFPLSRHNLASTLRIGYLGDYQQAKANNLKQHHYAHLFVIGWTKTFSFEH